MSYCVSIESRHSRPVIKVFNPDRSRKVLSFFAVITVLVWEGLAASSAHLRPVIMTCELIVGYVAA